MLSDGERDALVGIELDLWLEDPDLVAALIRHRPAPRGRLAYDVVIGLAVLGGTLCLALGEVGGSEGSITAFVFAVVAWLVRKARFGTG